ncbi:MAG: SusC/RagA family TonB-linked outer membrane protein, partial [Bacteroidales bacterium]|nr:SusC/RagA family TonB-linked outer membrane protein [Bacteroidales bacterium]
MRKTNVFRKGSFLTLFLMLLVPLTLYPQDISVSGTVVDQQGLTLPGVNILIQGTSRGVITDMDGKYQVTAPGDAVLVFNFLGFQEQVIPINNQRVIDVQLKDTYTALSEVVVVGYGQMRRTDVTGSMVSVSSDAIEKSVPTSIDQVLQGRAAGVQVQQNSGTPGGSSSIRIRGINSLNSSNEPIFVIDGIVIDGSTESSSDNPLSSINPADIVSMDVLKDASATAIYGSRAANGVILVTTKRGKAGEARVTYDGYVGFQEMPTKLDLLNLTEYAVHKNARADAGIVTRDNYFVRDDLLGTGTDWQDELFQTALMHSHNLGISGGSEKSTYSMGIGYLDQEGIAIGSGFE